MPLFRPYFGRIFPYIDLENTSDRLGPPVVMFLDYDAHDPLVNLYIAMENLYILVARKIHYFYGHLWAMFDSYVSHYQRVTSS